MNEQFDKKPSERLIEKVIPNILEKGFIYNKSKKEFTRNFQLGKQGFYLRFSGRGGLSTVDCGLFIFFEELDKLYCKIFDKKNEYSSYQLGEPNLRLLYMDIKNLMNDPGFLFEDKFGEMSITEKAKYSSFEVHPEYKIVQVVNFILESYKLFAEPTFEKLNNYENLFLHLQQSIEMRINKNRYIFGYLDLPRNDEVLIYYSLILALCLSKETTRIMDFANQMFKDYYNFEDILNNIDKIFIFHEKENLIGILN